MTPTSLTGLRAGATGEPLPRACGGPRPTEKLAGSPSPQGSDHSLSRAGTRAAARSCLGAGTGYIPEAAPDRARPHPRPGTARSATSGSARPAPEPLGSSPLHRRRELGAFSSVSGLVCFSLRPRQRCDWRWRPTKVPVLVSRLQRRERLEPPRDRH